MAVSLYSFRNDEKEKVAESIWLLLRYKEKTRDSMFVKKVKAVKRQRKKFEREREI